MKKTLAILAACLTLGVSTPSASATAQDTTAVTTAMKADSTVTTPDFVNAYPKTHRRTKVQ